MTHTLLSSPLPRNLAGKLLNEPGQPESPPVRGDQGGKRGGSGPRQRSAAGHETWLLLGLGTWILSRLNHPGLGPFNPGVFVPLSLPYPGVRIRPVGLNQVGPEFQDFY